VVFLWEDHRGTKRQRKVYEPISKVCGHLGAKTHTNQSQSVRILLYVPMRQGMWQHPFLPFANLSIRY